MSVKFPRRPVFVKFRHSHRSIWGGLILPLLLVIAVALAILIPSATYFHEISGAMALSDAEDIITAAINRIVLKKMSEPGLNYDYFVSFERNNAGDVTAIATNMVRVNTLSSELLNAVVAESNQGNFDLRIPLGSLLGSGLLLGRGPRVPVRITMLTSSRAGFRNELVSAGINQTKHQVMLELYVDINVLLPWEMLSTRVMSNVLVAETIIVGSVPDTYLNWEKTDG